MPASNNTDQLKGCLCYNGKHPKTWHCIIKAKKLKGMFLADFPFNRPQTHDTGFWEKKAFHKIKNWGKVP